MKKNFKIFDSARSYRTLFDRVFCWSRAELRALRKTLIFSVLWLLNKWLTLKADVNVPTCTFRISNKTWKKNIFVVGILKATAEKSRIQIRNTIEKYVYSGLQKGTVTNKKKTCTGTCPHRWQVHAEYQGWHRLPPPERIRTVTNTQKELQRVFTACGVSAFRDMPGASVPDTELESSGSGEKRVSKYVSK